MAQRLKTNAATLRRRKARYQLFLVQLLVVIGLLLSELLLRTSFLAIPYKYVLQWALPEIYGGDIVDAEIHPYFVSGLLFVSVTTLVLFFASGMYSEKIAYANRYVPHANKALRSLNMYLNVRKPPLRSKFPLNPLSFFFPRPSEPPSRPMSPTRAPSPGGRVSAASTTLQTIPHTTNPRGELIFSSRVDRGFREAYERYRSAFERKRDERQRLDDAKTWWGWLMLKMPWSEGLPTPPPASLLQHAHTRTLSGSPRGRASSGHTPNASRRSSPAPRPGGLRIGDTPTRRSASDPMRESSAKS
ncbi:hypothetical protein HWV62_45509 [Athelia sp. TMB]|nr:hypothetical protein HWV62_45509 [Athelia sp. TMB]